MKKPIPQRYLFFFRYNHMNILRCWLVIAPKFEEARAVIIHKYHMEDKEVPGRQIGQIDPIIAEGFRVITAELECRPIVNGTVSAGIMKDPAGLPMRKSTIAATSGEWLEIPLDTSLGAKKFREVAEFFMSFREWPQHKARLSSVVAAEILAEPQSAITPIDWETAREEAHERHLREKRPHTVNGKPLTVLPNQLGLGLKA